MDLLSGLKSFFKTDSTAIDNNVFRLHYKATVLILVAFSILVTGRQYIGDPIDCLSTKDVREDLLDTFCWIHTTFSLTKAWKTKVDRYGVPYPGVDKDEEGDQRVYHAYYQWVCFVLFLQAIFFYIPRYFWKAMEGGRIRNLILGLNSPILAEETRISNRKLLVEYMATNLKNHNVYFYSYVCAEVMNFINVVGQIFLTDKLLGGKFLSYGSHVMGFNEWDYSLSYDPMIEVFPRAAKCTFHYHGPSGNVQKVDTMCILPINIINEKIYLFLWFWFLVLAALSGLVLLYRLSIILWPRTRLAVLRSRGRLVNRDALHVVVKKCGLGDWLLLDLLCKNLEPCNFRDIVSDLARRVEDKSLTSAFDTMT